MTLEEFAKWTRHAAQVTENNVAQVVRKCALVIDGAVVLATPVDTGRARSNWVVSLDQPVTTTREPYRPGKARSTEGENSRAALAQGQMAIARYTPQNREIFITNNLPYIGRLNNGYSGQAPAGFVETAVLQGVNAVSPEWRRLTL